MNGTHTDHCTGGGRDPSYWLEGGCPLPHLLKRRAFSTLADARPQPTDPVGGTVPSIEAPVGRAFFGRGWPEYELDGFVTRAVSGEQILLPIWHGVTKREVMDYSPSLADRIARNTLTHTVEEIAAEIVDVIRNPPES